jgi:ParB/RepB/Spo0J family partition protein
MKKKVKVEEVEVEAETKPLTWTVSDDMMSITLSDGRRGKAIEDCDCKLCMMEKTCDLNSTSTPLAELCCVQSKRRGSPLPKNIIWIERQADDLPPVVLDEVPVNPDVVIPDALAKIPSGLIEDSPYQVRQIDEGSDSFKELVESVKANGLCNPLTVRKLKEDRYELIAGHRRRRACDLAGMMSIPCYIRSVDEEEAEALTCVENLNREDLLPIDEALTVKAMLDHGRSREEIAKITGKSVRWVYRREAAARLEVVWIEKAKKYKLSSKFLEVLSAIDAGTREAITQDDDFNDDGFRIFQDGGDIDQLEWDSGMRRRKVTCAPWMALFPQECTECKKRTDTSEIIADEESDSQCLDAECWNRSLASYGDRAEAHYKTQGVDVRRVKEDDAYQMDLEDEQTDEYDVCVLVEDDDGVQIHWGRSKPSSAKLAKKVAERKQTDRNIAEKAYAEEVMARIEEIIARPVDTASDLRFLLYKHLITAAISCGMDMVAPEGVQSWQSPNRASGCTSWMMEEGFSANDVLEALSSCVLAGASSKLRIYNPMDTSSAYIYAQAYVMAFEMPVAEVTKAAEARIPKPKKAKRK